ncbi:hypothetical protein [Longimicrobium sp.]|uniref:hypothetical protein n=1 Tax=Longimicrobium sp. TaxID=2029185 RepID=UPI002B6C4594|nr:hypothetical protein [Longimicrobium sp.]HSU17996.1 hypothetical protein [Longimicrobium sp.]
MNVLRGILAAFLLALAMVSLPAVAGAQTRQLLDARVRVTAPPVRPDKVTGQVTRFDTAQLVVRDEATGTEQSFPLHSIQLLEISRGRTAGGSAASRAGLLAFVGGGLGAIAGLLIPGEGSAGGRIALFGGGGAVVGGAIGAAWGSSAPRERWEWAVRPFGYDPSARAPVLAPPPPPS